MPQIFSSRVSCGINQISNIFEFNKEEAALRKWILRVVATQYEDNDPDEVSLQENAIYLFSDTDNAGNGEWLAEMIEKHDLGHVVKFLDGHTNENSNNEISAWSWCYNGHVIPNPVRTPRKVGAKVIVKRKPKARLYGRLSR